jgi:hypothetical protein
MCWNSEVSLNTFLFSSFVLVLIIYNNAYTKYKIEELNNIWIYLFFASFIFMQLIEFFIWRNIDNKFYNKMFSILAILLLLVQPVCSLLIIKNKQIKQILLFIYLLLALPYSIWKFSTENIHSIISKSGHLEWIFFKLPPAWFFFLLFPLFYEKKWVGCIFGVFLLGISAYTYTKDRTIGTMWCWLINSVFIYYAIYLLFYLPFCENKTKC